MKAKSWIFPALIVAAACGGGGGGGVPVSPLAVGLRISEVAIFQGLKTPLVVDGQAVAVTDRKVPVIRGRKGLLRIYVAPEDGITWTPRTIIAKLEITSKGKALPAKTAEMMISAASVESDLNSTFNFEIAGEDVTDDFAWVVSLREQKFTPGLPGTKDGAQYPPASTKEKSPLGAVSVGPSLKVKIVPIEYLADGSGRLPDTSPAALEKLRDKMFALYPAPMIDMTVRDPLPYSGVVSRNGSGWSNLLNTVLQTRSEDGAPDDVYYYGLFNPASSFQAFCSGGCVAGLSALAQSPTDSFQRGSIGLGYDGRISTGTLVHEVGHAHGRRHANCGGAQGIDPQFPYPNARIGIWGYDLVAKTLIDPEGTARDMMGYCEPDWISDYTYRALFDRISAVNMVSQRIQGGAATTWRILMVDGDGRATPGAVVTLTTPPESDPVSLDLLDESGAPVRRATGHYYPYDHLPGGMLLVPHHTDEKLFLDMRGDRIPL